MTKINPDALAAIRKKAGLSYRELAELAGVSHSFISDIERGARQGSEETVRRLAGALEVPESAISSLVEEVGA